MGRPVTAWVPVPGGFANGAGDGPASCVYRIDQSMPTAVCSVRLPVKREGCPVARFDYQVKPPRLMNSVFDTTVLLFFGVVVFVRTELVVRE